VRAAALKPPAFRCARLVLQAARYRGQRSAWQVGAAAPSPPLSAALDSPRRRFADAENEAHGRWGLPPQHPVFCCARLVLQTTRYRGKRNAYHPARALAHSSRQISRVGARMRWQLELSPLLTDGRAARFLSQPNLISEAISSVITPPPGASNGACLA
jgi:hypothetical protein